MTHKLQGKAAAKPAMTCCVQWMVTVHSPAASTDPTTANRQSHHARISPLLPLPLLFKPQVCLLYISDGIVPLQLLQPLVCRQEVLLEVEVGEVVAVEEVGRKLLQTAAGQIHRVDPLGHHLDEGGQDSEKEEKGRQAGLPRAHES